MTRAKRRRGRRPVPALEGLEARTLLSGGLIVGFAFSAGGAAQSARDAIHRLGGAIVETFPSGQALVRAVSGDPGAEARLAARLQRLPMIAYAEPDSTLKVDAVVPNDRDFGRQWGLSQFSDIDINAPEAWQITTGRASTIVAVIDSGFDLSHPDLVGRVWVNPGEIPGNGIDDDGDGFIDDVNGWNFLGRNNNVRDDAGHGTHVAGIIAARANGGGALVGVNWQAKIMPLKFIDARGDGSLSDAVRAIYFAVNHGADVINASWGGPDASRALADAVRYAGRKNVVFVTAAGNESANNDSVPSFPANFRFDNVLSVAAVDQNGRLAGFSNFGRRTVDIAAPGVGIRSTVPGGYATMSGTSMATPFVTGVVSLLVGRYPSWTAAQLAQRVRDTVKKLRGLDQRTISGGMVDALRALDPSASTRAATAPSLSDADLVRSSLLGSAEYFRRAGSTAQGFVTALYRDVLGRTPTSAERAAMLRSLMHGAGRAGVARDLMRSVEALRTKVARWYRSDLNASGTLVNLKKYGPVVRIADRLAAGLDESDARAELLGGTILLGRVDGDLPSLVAALYRRVFAREANWDEIMTGSQELAMGTTRTALVRSLLTSAEGRATRVARMVRDDLRRGVPLEALKADSNVLALAKRLKD
jgi:thermitase